MTHHFHRSLPLVVLGASLFLAFFLPSPARAYFMTNQEAAPLQGSALFLMEYTFGLENHALSMPVLADDSKEKRSDRVSFTIVDGNGMEVEGESSAIVLAAAPLEDDLMYSVSEGKAQKFVLVAVFTPDVEDPGARYRLKVTHLPFMLDETRQSLNSSELEAYRTELTSVR